MKTMSTKGRRRISDLFWNQHFHCGQCKINWSTE